ncbi:DNA polymerase I [uncultured Clostridium sp.]|jgi:DNA polymerase-1|uniref:DNA polymerase I n=1 Tax=uncultured Clostridium sp. TaxID=59620 RepID=UPI0026166BBB|nr:DNA polymerase I [uncultured Clostridium sp.]
MERLLILDGNSLLNRAFYGIPLLSNKNGVYTNAVFGFTNMLFKMKNDIAPDHIVCTFDRKAPTFRHLEYSEYKAGRKKMPDELRGQFPIVKEILEKLSVTIYEMDGFEADDLIGSLAKYAESEGMEVFIMTGDHDALQLATDNTNVCITKKGVSEIDCFDKARMIEDFGVTPTQFIDVKGLMGDKSDNIPGVPGIGEVNAYKLIQEYGSIENTIMNAENISGKKIRENLIEYTEQAIFSKKLATINVDVPIEFDLDEIRSVGNYDLDGLKRMFTKLEIKIADANIAKFAGVSVEDLKAEEFKSDIIEIVTTNDLKELINSLDKEIFIKFTAKNEELYSTIAFEKIFINSNEKNYVLLMESLVDLEAKSLLKELFESEDIKKTFYNAKVAMRILSRDDIEVKGLEFDIELAAYLLDSSKGKYPMINLIEIYLEEYPNFEEDQKDIVEITYLAKLAAVLKEKIKETEMEELLYDIELPLTRVLAAMEEIGFTVDRTMLDELSVRFRGELDRTQKEIYELSEEEFNINSPKQLGKILFEKLDLPVIKKTKTGYSTNAEVLEKLNDKHPIIEKVVYYRQLAKIYSTYVEGLKAVIDEDGAIHSNFNQTITTTGRLSSTEPNLQNIPIKYEMGREIRKVFTARGEEQCILSADYSQVELRILAHISEDKNMIDAFNHHSDIHTKTASEVFNVPIEDVTSTMRGRAKAVNFGIVYGMSDFSLAKDLNITRNEAKEYMDIYFDRYPNIKVFIENVINEAQTNGYVKTIYNRRRFIPEIAASNKMVKAMGERLAMNAPIQGTAADIIKIAMVNVWNELEKRKLKSKLILQVHDELILNVYNDELEEIKALIKDEMENVVKLDVPLDIDMNIGKTWYEAK